MGGQYTRMMAAGLVRAATLVTALVVSISGIVGRGGIVIPHLARMIVGLNFWRVMPVTAPLGNAHRFLDIVLRLHAQGIGILMTTHFPDHALYLRAQTLVLKDKTLWKHGAAKDVIDEAGMTELYELPVHIGNIGTRTVCVGGDIA